MQIQWHCETELAKASCVPTIRMRMGKKTRVKETAADHFKSFRLTQNWQKLWASFHLELLALHRIQAFTPELLRT